MSGTECSSPSSGRGTVCFDLFFNSLQLLLFLIDIYVVNCCNPTELELYNSELITIEV
jgi:hypothetical protein